MKLIPLFIYAASPVQYFDDGSFETGGILGADDVFRFLEQHCHK